MLFNEEREEILKQRKALLTEQAKLWDNHCDKCEDFYQGKKDGIVPATKFKDSNNPVCDVCPIDIRMKEIGKELANLMLEDRALRGVDK